MALTGFRNPAVPSNRGDLGYRSVLPASSATGRARCAPPQEAQRWSGHANPFIAVQWFSFALGENSGVNTPGPFLSH
jgi:hypothetical protein